MPDKVLLAAIGADALFLATGAIQLGFCLVAQGIRDDAPRTGQEAIRNLLYQRLPLTAGIANAAFVLATFAFTLPGLASQGRAWLKLAGYMVTFCGLFSLCVGVFLWVMTLRVKADFSPVYLDLEDSLQSLVQTSVCFTFSSSAVIGSCGGVCFTGTSVCLWLSAVANQPSLCLNSLIAAATLIVPRQHSSQTLLVPALRPRRC